MILVFNVNCFYKYKDELIGLIICYITSEIIYIIYILFNIYKIRELQKMPEEEICREGYKCAEMCAK